MPKVFISSTSHGFATGRDGLTFEGFEVGTGQARRFPIEELYIPLTTSAAERAGLDIFGIAVDQLNQNVPSPRRAWRNLRYINSLQYNVSWLDP